jgi:hypothetical protein
MPGPGLELSQTQQREIGRRPCKQERIDAVEDAAVAQEQAARVLRPQVALEEGLEQVADRGRDHDHSAEEERVPTVAQELLFVEPHPGREDAGDRAHHEALPRLPRRDGGAHLVPPGDAPAHVRERVRHEDRQENRVQREVIALGSLANEQEETEPEPDPRRSEHRRPDCNGRRLPRLGHCGEHEREDEARKKAADHPAEPAELSSEERSGGSAVAGQHERTKLPGKAVELVQGEQRRDPGEREQKPPAEVGRSEDQDEARNGDEQSRQDSAHRPPKRRRRPAYSTSACRSWRSPKSGQRVSTK